MTAIIMTAIIMTSIIMTAIIMNKRVSKVIIMQYFLFSENKTKIVIPVVNEIDCSLN